MIKVGLVGSGSWAENTHGRMHVDDGPTELVGVWARNPNKAKNVADRLFVPAYEEFDDLLNVCDALDFAIPPEAQTPLALRAASAGKGLLLEKPISRDLGAARELQAEVERAGVPTAVAMTRRYHHKTHRFYEQVARLKEVGALHGAQASFLHGGALPGGFLDITGTWREEVTGPLFDLGIHVIDLVLAALGEAESAHCSSSGTYTTIEMRHQHAVQSQIAVSLHTGVSPSIHEVSVYGTGGVAKFTTVGMDQSECWVRLRHEFARAMGGGEPATVTVADAFGVQLVLDACERSLKSGKWETLAEH